VVVKMSESPTYIDVQERPRQGKGQMMRMPSPGHTMARAGPMQCRKRLAGLLKYSYGEAA
jgi:hypothetical protein